jgi:hypothetical protein
MPKKFERLDAAHAYTRHITSPRVEAFIVEVADCMDQAMGKPQELATNGMQEIPAAMPSSKSAMTAAAKK